MKAITIHQPYATLIAIGAKRYETRGWLTRYRGPIAIHAGKNMDGIYDLAKEVHIHNTGLPYSTFAQAVFDALLSSGYYPSPFTCAQFPVGSIVATGTLVDCIKTSSLEPSEQERAFGGWGIGRFAWEIANIQYLYKPIPARGAQGLWDWQVAL